MTVTAPLLWICITTEIPSNDLRWVLLTRENKMSQAHKIFTIYL